MTTEQTGALWLDPDSFSTGGFMDDVDCTIVSAKVDTWSEAEGKLFLHVDFLVDGAEEPRTEYYSIGSLEKFTPSKDHKRAIPAEGVKGMNAGTKAALFFKSLLDAGFDKANLTPEVTFLEGLRVHVNNVPMQIKGDSAEFKKRKGGKDGGEQRAPSVVLITKLLDSPAPAAAAPAKGKAAPKAKAAAAPAAAAESADAEEVTTAAILEALAEKNPIGKRLLPTEMFRRVKGDGAVKSAAMKLVGDNDWLGSGDRPWTFDAGTGDLTI